MILFIYNLLLVIVSIAVFPFLLGILLSRRKWRQGLAQRLGHLSPQIVDDLKGRRPLWLHAVSVGEVIAAVPILRRIRARHPTLPIVLSTVTVTGNYTARKELPEVDHVIYYPFDYYWISMRVIRKINPRLFLHTETEIWPNFLFVLGRLGIPSIIVNGRLSGKSTRRYRMAGFLFRKVVSNITVFGMQSQVDCNRAIEIGADPKQVLLTGNMKFDREVALLKDEEASAIVRELRLGKGRDIFIAGSTHKGEEEIILAVFDRLVSEFPTLALVLAPRHPERFADVAKLVSEAGFVCARKSRPEDDRFGPEGPQVMVLDTIGELSRTYGIGTVIFVGGTLVNVGGHNLLEPVAYRKPVLFGPHVQNTHEVADALKTTGGGIEISGVSDFHRWARDLLKDGKLRERLGNRAFDVILRNQGATERNLAIVERFL